MASPVPWLFFLFQLPARRASARVSVWRKLQKYGALPWKNSAYLLPQTPGNLEKLQWLSAEIRKSGGDASIAEVSRVASYSERQIAALFNAARAADYERLTRDLRRALKSGPATGSNGRSGLLARSNRRLAEIAAVDTFGCPKRRDAEKLLKVLEARERAGPAAPPARKKGAGQYRNRVWMTRPRPEVDRVASAWLIRNLIDPKARFVFFSEPGAQPGAVRFDMFEGEFTHVGDDCTFETLVKRFALRDRRLRAIAQLVHDADLEDGKFGRPEGKALDLIFKGWARKEMADDEILKRGFELFDALYLTYL